MGAVLEGPDAMRRFHFMQVYHALKLQAETGRPFSNRGSIIKVAQQQFGVRSRTAKGALAEMEVLRGELGF